MKLLFFISSLECGGAQRVCVTLCNHWAAQGWNVTVATFDDGSEPPFFRLAPEVRHVPLDLRSRSTSSWSAVANNVRRVLRMREFLLRERPERILSFIDTTNVLALFAAAGTGVPVIVSERTDPSRHPLPRSWRILRRLAYRFAFAIAVQTRSVREFFPASWRPWIAVIPNPVPELMAGTRERSRSAAERQTILGMGRLERAKGFDLLIRAFAEAARRRPEWDLSITGEGEEREALEALARALGVTGRVALPGWEPDAVAALRRADVFVLPSRYEGFPNALCEAMACGLPVIAFDCASGPADIVRDGIDGRLVPAEDVAALAAAIVELTGSAEQRRRFGGEAVAVAERFSIERIAARWERMLVGGAANALEPAGEAR